MRIMYVSLKGLMHCTSCMTTIENALYSSGAKHFEYDMSTHMGKIVFDDLDADEIKLVDSIKRVGFDVDVLEISDIEED